MKRLWTLSLATLVVLCLSRGALFAQEHVLSITGPGGASGSGVLSSTFSVDLTGGDVQAYTFGLSSSDAASIISVTTDGTAAAGAGFVDIRDGENGSGACKAVAVVVDFTGAGGVVGTGDSLLSITAEDDGVQPRDITLSLSSCSGPGDQVVPTVTVGGVSKTPTTNDKTYSIAGSDYGLTVETSQDLFPGGQVAGLPIDFTVTSSGSDVQAVQLGVTYEGSGSITGITSDDAALLIVELGTTSGGDACSVVAALRDLTGTGATWGDGDTVLVVATTQDSAPGTATVGIGSVCDAGGEPTSALVTVGGDSIVPWTVDKTVSITDAEFALTVETSQDLYSGDNGTALPIDFTVTNSGSDVQAVQLGITSSGSITGITSDSAGLLIVELGTTSGGDACSVVAALRDVSGSGDTWGDGDSVLVVATTQDAAPGTATVGIGSACDAGGEPTSALVTVGGSSIVPLTVDKTVSTSGDVIFDFEPTAIGGRRGETVQVSSVLVVNSLGHSGEAVQGFQLGISAAGAISLVDLTTTGSDAGDLIDANGFSTCEQVTGGAICAAVLDYDSSATLPSGAVSSMAIATIEGTIPATGSETGSLSYVNGLPSSGSVTIDNLATAGGVSKAAFLSTIDVDIVEALCCNEALVYYIGGERISDFYAPVDASPRGASDFPDLGVTCQGTDLSQSVEGREGEVGSAEVNISVISALPGPDTIQAWNVSVKLSNLVVSGSERSNTGAATTDDGGFADRNGNFYSAEVALPADNGGSYGFVSAATLSFGQEFDLPLTGTETIVRLFVETPNALDADGATGSVFLSDGLRGETAGVPVSNNFTVGSAEANGCNTNLVNHTITFAVPEFSEFVRCDPNDDGGTDIADAIHIINDLFRSGPAPTCADAADCNNSGDKDLADASYAIAYLFTGGTMPEAPFPSCGEPTDGDDVDCADQSSCP